MSEKIDIPEAEKGKAAAIMGDKFKAAMGDTPKPVAAAPAATPAAAPMTPTPDKPPAAAPAAVPASTAPPELKGKARESFEKLEGEMKKHRDAYEKLLKEHEPTKAELEQLRVEKAKFADVQKQMDSIKAEAEAIKKQGAEYESIVKQFYVENDPQFQKHFGERLGAAITEAKDAVGAGNAGKVEQILSYPPGDFRDQQLEAVAEELSDFKRTALVNAYQNFQRTERERREELKKAPENYQKLQALREKEAKDHEAQTAQSRAALVDHVVKQIEPELAGVDATLADNIRATVKNMIEGKIDGENYVQVLVDSAKGKKYAATMKEKDEQIAKLSAQIQELTASNPSLNPGGSVPIKKQDQSVGSLYDAALSGKLKPGWSKG